MGDPASKDNEILERIRFLQIWRDTGPGTIWPGQEGHSAELRLQGSRQARQEEAYERCGRLLAKKGDRGAQDVPALKYCFTD